jgi:hypothetical protein
MKAKVVIKRTKKRKGAKRRMVVGRKDLRASFSSLMVDHPGLKDGSVLW